MAQTRRILCGYGATFSCTATYIGFLKIPNLIPIRFTAYRTDSKLCLQVKFISQPHAVKKNPPVADFLTMGDQVQYHTEYKQYRDYAQNDFLAVMRCAGLVMAMVAITMTIAHHQHPRQPQHQCRKYKQPWLYPRGQY